MVKTFYLLDDPSRDKHFHFYLLKALKRAYFDPTVIYFRGKCPSYWVEENISALSFELSSRVYKNFNPLPILKIASLIKRIRPQIIHVQRHRPLIYTALALKILRQKIPLFYTIRLSRLIRTPARKLAFNLVKDQVTYVIAVSRGAGEDFIRRTRLPRQKLKIIPNGLDPTPFDLDVPKREARKRFSLPEEGFFFGMVARFRKVKDHPGLLKAFASVKDKMPGAFLTLVGDGPEEKKIKKLVLELGLEERIFFTGRLPPAEIPVVLRAFDVFVHPTFREGMPAAILEAMAARLPIIATPAEGITDIFETPRVFGRLIPFGDTVALASTLLGFYQLSKKDLASLGEEARRRLEEDFTKEKMVARNLALYRECLS